MTGSYVTSITGSQDDQAHGLACKPDEAAHGGPGWATHKRRPKKRKERLLHEGNKTRIRIQERLVLILLLVGLIM